MIRKVVGSLVDAAEQALACSGLAGERPLFAVEQASR
jgi:hypothetical protein